MALNPFAKEFVPPAGATPGMKGGLSGLKISTKEQNNGDQSPVGDQTKQARARNLQGAMDFSSTVNKASPSKPPRPPKGQQPSTVQIPGQSKSVTEEMDFDELFNQSPKSGSSNPASLAGEAQRRSFEAEAGRNEQFRQDLHDHQELHHVVPPNIHKGSPSMLGLKDEQDLLDSVDSAFVRTAEDVQDIKDAISVPEAEIQENELEKDVVPRAAGQVAAGDDPDDVEEEVQLGHSIRRQDSIFPDGLQQAEDEGVSTSRRLSPQDFEMHTVLGQGAFGKVFLVSKRDTGELFAMKVMRKDKILQKDHGAYVAAEREVLTAVVHPYIVTLQYSFQTSSKLYLMLDFINGGHLFFQLYREGIFSEDLARLYCAEIVLAISHLHNCGFVHRDLKPENVLLDSEGHVKITDFGLSKKNIDDETRTNSFIGTMEYMAPEIINGTGHGKSVDWWSVGILLYEMLAGMPPFRAKSQNALKKQITGGKLKFPTYLSSQSLNILKAFLNRDPKKRLGYGPHGSEDVMKHVFFKTVDWGKLFKRELKSPFRPAVKSSQSVENFDKIWTDLPPVDSPCATPDHAGMKDAFKDFSYYGQDEREILAKSAGSQGSKASRQLFDPDQIEKPVL